MPFPPQELATLPPGSEYRGRAGSCCAAWMERRTSIGSIMTVVDALVLDIDGGAMLESCLASLARQTQRIREVVVFDNGSRVPVSVRTTGVRTLRSEINLGFTGGVNEAYAATSGELVALINNDVVLDDDWLQTVVEAMDGDPGLGAVQTWIRRDENTLDGAGIDVSDGTIRQVGSGVSPQSAIAPAWGVSATAALYRRSAVGSRPFDPRFFAYYEDADLCARLHDEGWRTAVVPLVKATHAGSRSSARVEATRLRTRNRYLVARMHPGVGRVSALLSEDVRLLMRGRSSLRGIMQGLFTRISDGESR